MKEEELKNNELFNVYSMYEVIYEERIKNKFENILIFPDNWYKIFDYRVKIEILKEAIINDKLIINTEIYKNIMK